MKVISAHGVLVVAGLLASGLQAQSLGGTEKYSNLEYLTTEPEDDESPVFSPDGKWMVFVSNRTGDRDIYIRRLDQYQLEQPKALAPNAADDTEPAFSVDGHWLAWKSMREDVFGDIWVMQFPNGEPFCVTERGRSDSSPRWIVRGKKQSLLYQVEEDNSEPKWYVTDAGDWKSTLWEHPVEISNNLRLNYEDDTNGDGVASHESGDDPSVWIQSDESTVWRQLTPPMRGLNSPVLHEGKLVFSARMNGGLDIFRAVKPFEVAQIKDAEDALEQAREMWRNNPFRPFDAVALARQGFLLEPATESGQKCAMLAASILESVKRPEQASMMIKYAGRQSAATPDIAAELQCRRAVLELIVSRRRGDDEARRTELASQTYEILQKVFIQTELSVSLRAQVGLWLAPLAESEMGTEDALEILMQTEELKNAPVETRARAALFRLKLSFSHVGGNFYSAFQEFARKYPTAHAVHEDAAREFAQYIATGDSLDSNILNLRDAYSRFANYPIFQAVLATEEAELFINAGRIDEGRSALGAAIAHRESAPRVAARASFRLAELQTNQREYVEAMQTYESVAENVRNQFFAESPRFYREAREGFIREFLAKGYDELRLNDAYLARSTFKELIDAEPYLTEAWRGLIDAESRVGLLDRERLKELKRETENKPNSSLAWYVYGLALTYEDPASVKAIKMLERAIALDGSIPYYHQTLGFVYEMRARTENRRDNWGRAFSEYQRALALTDVSGRPADYARLLINTGNAAFALGTHARAAEYYQRRLDQAVRFDDPRTEYLMLRQKGIAEFRTFQPRMAVAAFSNAEQVLKEIHERGLVEDEAYHSMGTELMDRRALALMDAGAYRESADLFGEVANRQATNSLNRVRALRNKGFALHRFSLQQRGIERIRIRGEALSSLRNALELVQSDDLKIPKLNSGTGFFGLSMAMSSSDEGGAALEFSKEDEARLLRMGIARMELESGNARDAAVELRAQLDSFPTLNDKNRAYMTTARLIAFDQLAREEERLGNRAEAVESLLQALQATRYEIDGMEIINPNGLSRVLMHFVEVVLSGDGELVKISGLKKTWLGNRIESSGDLETLDECLKYALTLREEGTEEYLLQMPADRARLLLGRALLAERAFVENQDDPNISTIHARRAETLASQVLDQLKLPGADQEAKRMAVFACALRVRQVCRFQPDRLEIILANTRRTLQKYGYSDLLWWIDYQRYMTSPENEKLEIALTILEELESNIPVLSSENVLSAAALIRELENRTVAHAMEENNWELALERTERWRAVELAQYSSAMTPSPRLSDGEDAEWLSTALKLRETYRDAIRRLREASPLSDPKGLLDALEQAKSQYSKQLKSGREAWLPSAGLFSPIPLKVDNPVHALMDAVALPVTPGFILSTSSGVVVWTESDVRRVHSIDEWNNVNNKKSLWFVMGAPLPTGWSVDGNIVNVLMLQTTIQSMQELYFETGASYASWPLEKDSGVFETEASSTVEKLQITPDVEPVSVDPMNWILGDTNETLGSLLIENPDLNELALNLDHSFPANYGDKNWRAKALASMSAQQGLRSLSIESEKWNGVSFHASELPEMAQDYLWASTGSVRYYLTDKVDLPKALLHAQRVHYLRKALAMSDDDIVESGILLADIQSQLSLKVNAVETMKEVLDLLENQGDEEKTLIALKLMASYLVDANRPLDAAEKLRRAEEKYFALGSDDDVAEMIARQGVAFENAGKYNDALDQYHRALTKFDSLHRERDAIEQLRRIGRVYLQKLSNYPKAEEAFSRALARAKQSGDGDIVVLITLDLARVDERLGRYDAAITLAELMEEKARETGAKLLQTDALLVRAFVEWARGDYFEAFKAQRQAVAIANDLDDKPFQIIAHNDAGLIYWTLNDTEAALREYDAALSIARKELFPGEVASTLNNRALVYRSMGQYDEALRNLNEALEIDERQANLWGQAYAQRNIGMTYLQRGDAAEAIKPLKFARNTSADIGDRTNRAKAVLALADAYFATGDGEGSLDVYEDALQEARALPLPEVEWRALYGLARVALEMGDGVQARTRLAEAINVVEKMRARIRVEEFQDGFLLDKQELYDEMISLLLDEGDVVEALQYSERSRARHFIDLLGNTKLDLASVKNQSALEREEKLRAEIERLEKLANSSSAEEKDAVVEQLRETRRLYSEFLIELRAFNPQLSNFVEVSTLEPAALQSLLDQGTVLLEYHVLPDELTIWVVSRERIQVVRVPVRRDELTARIFTYRQRLQNFARVEEENAILSQWLWNPVSALVGDAERLAISPHRELHLMPFASLRTADGYLIDRFALFHTPSASVLQYTMGRRRSERNNRVLAIGNPDLGTEALSLPFAQKEAERIAWTFPDADVITGREATETWVKQNVANYGIVHLASHGEYDPSMPLMSSILLSKDGENDGLLTADEVFSLSLNADMVALSACQSGLGRLSNGDDVVGLNRAFVYAGTRQILSSLWRVDDVSTAVMVKHFYRNMPTMDRAEALRQAQLETRRRYPHPAHWAGLTLSGDWQ